MIDKRTVKALWIWCINKRNFVGAKPTCSNPSNHGALELLGACRSGLVMVDALHGLHGAIQRPHSSV
jgi:hypothetical protein